jgi:hypothetical protein
MLRGDMSPGDSFGCSVALEGNTTLIGAIGESASDSAFVFIREGDAWTRQATLLPAEVDDYDHIGGNVAFNGNIGIVGARLNYDTDGESVAGYLFSRAGANWTEHARLEPDSPAYSWIAPNVALDDDTAITGAEWYWPAGQDPGAAYVFRLFADDDVPATGIVGLALLLTAVVGTGAHFGRRPAGR